MKRKNGFRIILGQTIRKNKLLIMSLMGVTAGAIGFTMIPPLILGRIVNQITQGKGIAFTTALFYFVFLILSGLFDAVKEVFITIFGQKVTRGLRSEMCAKLLRLPAAYFTKNESGAVTSRFVNDADAVESLFTNGIISIFVDGAKMIGIIIMIWTQSFGLGVIMLCITPLLFVVTRHFQKQVLKAQSANRTAIGKVNNHVPETMRNIRMIQTLYKQEYMEKRYDDYLRESYQSVEKSNFYDSVYSPIIILCSSMLIAIMMILASKDGSLQLFFGLSAGAAVTVINYVGKVFEPLEAIGMEIQNIQSAAGGVKRINEFLSEKETTDNGDTVWETQIEDSDSQAAISFQNVDFSYDCETEILSGLSFEIRKGENAVLTGRTGAGKSTVFRLLLGLYEPDAGSVCVFGRNPSNIPAGQKRRVFGYVEQKFTAVPGSVKEQITLFDSSISEEMMETAARAAGIHEHIMSLEDGYQTDFQTQLFSQGQLQLLSIARAVVLNPSILPLDEMTANLDSATEIQVIEALRNAAENRTVLSISHRMAEKEGARIIPIEKK